MNPSEVNNAITVLVALAGPYLVQVGLTPSLLTNALTGLVGLAAFGWALYSHWNMRKVPENAVTTSPIPAKAMAQAIAVLAVALVSLIAIGQPSARAASSNPLNVLSTWADADVAAAIAASKQFPELQDQVGGACWAQISTLAKLIKAHPIPVTLHLATDIEYARLDQGALNLICRNSACSQVWSDMTNAVQSLNVTPMPLSFTSLCGKVPVVGLSLTTATPAPAGN